MPFASRVIVFGEVVALLNSCTLPVTAPVAVGAKRALNVLLCPAVKVNGVVNPVVLNPAPLTVEEEIVTDELPVFVIVTVWVLVDPTVTSPKLTFVGLVLNVSTGSIALPETVITLGEFGASLVIEMDPEAAPAAMGKNCTLKETACPGAIESGVANPVTLKPVPVTLAELMVRVVAPPFVNVTVWVAPVPTIVSPKVMLDGLAVSEPAAGLTALPARARRVGVFSALLVIDRPPVTMPAVVGEKDKLKLRT